MLNREEFATISGYVPEDTFFEARKGLHERGFQVKIIDQKWSDGSSPVILIKYKYWIP